MEAFAQMLAALGHPARLEIFRSLVRAGAEGRCVDDIRRKIEMPGSTLSHHLDTLQRCGLINGRRVHRFIYYAVDWARTGTLLQFLTEDCCVETKPVRRARAAPRVSRRRTA